MMAGKVDPIIMALAALLSGLFSGVAGGSLAIIFTWSKPWAVGLAAGTIAAVVTWISLLQWWQRFVEAINGVAQHEITPSAQTIYHAETGELVRVGLVSDEPGMYLNGEYYDFPVSREQLCAVAHSLALGSDFSHAALAGPGKPLSRSEYESLRNIFVRAGLARWTNPKAHSVGLSLTSRGRAVIRHFSESGSLPGWPTLLELRDPRNRYP